MVGMVTIFIPPMIYAGGIALDLQLAAFWAVCVATTVPRNFSWTQHLGPWHRDVPWRPVTSREWDDHLMVFKHHYPLVNVYKKLWKDPPCFMGKLTISTGPCSSSQTVSHYQRVNIITVIQPKKNGDFTRRHGTLDYNFWMQPTRTMLFSWDTMANIWMVYPL
jgi:hypothetical protein